MSKELIVYYSRTGSCEKVAKALQTKLNCDLEKITYKNRSEIIPFIDAGNEARQKAIAEISDTKFDPANYEKMIFISPVWGKRCQPPLEAI